MKAKICDRCKRFYEIDKAEAKDSYSITKRSATASRYTHAIDLCPKCQEELKEWYEKGVKNG